MASRRKALRMAGFGLCAVSLGLFLAWLLSRGEAPPRRSRAPAAGTRVEPPRPTVPRPRGEHEIAGGEGLPPPAAEDGQPDAKGIRSARVVIRVVDGGTGAPLEGFRFEGAAAAWIGEKRMLPVATRLAAETGSAGEAAFPLEGDGSVVGWHCTLQAPADPRERDYILLPKHLLQLEVRPGDRLEREIRLEQGGGISGRISMEGGEEIPPFFTLYCAPKAGDDGIMVNPEAAKAQLDWEEGRYRFRGLPPRGYFLFASGQGWDADPPRPEVEVPPGRRVEGPGIVLRRYPRLRGRLVGPDGAPLSSQPVSVATEVGWTMGFASTRTAEDGAFEISLSRHTAWASFRPHRFPWDWLPLDLDPEALKAALGSGELGTLRFRRGGRIRGRVVDAETGRDVPYDGIVTAALDRPKRGWSDRASLQIATGQDPETQGKGGGGWFEIPHLPAGKVTLSATTRSGKESAPLVVAVGEGESVGPVELLVRKEEKTLATISGSVRWGHTGEPAEGVRVEAVPADKAWESAHAPARLDGGGTGVAVAGAAAGPDGSFQISLPAGRYVLLALAWREGKGWRARSEAFDARVGAPVRQLLRLLPE